MANWCNNTVVFEGHSKAIEQIKDLFKSMAEKEKNEHCGQLPKFIAKDEGYFFDLNEDYMETEVFYYTTKWTPNIQTLIEIANHYNVAFQQDYEELGNLIYGRATFSDNILTDIHLDYEDFDQYHYEEQTDTHHFEGEEYDSECEILETLLERKIEKHFNNIKNQNNETIR